MKEKSQLDILLDELERATKEAYQRHNLQSILAYRKARAEVVALFERKASQEAK